MYKTKKRNTAAAKIQKAWRRYAAKKKATKRKTGRARPMNALKVSYRGMPNQYRFRREEVSTVIDLRTYATFGGTVSVFDIDNFKMSNIAKFVDDFSPLFASYKLDKVTFVMKPLWQISAVDVQGSGVITNPELSITRINTKYLTTSLALGGTDADIRASLAQLQMKSESSYSNKKNLYCTTAYPRLYSKVEDLSGQVEDTTVPGRWLNIANASDIEFALNQVLVFQKRDHSAIQGGVYKYEIKTIAYFRCSQVG